MKFFVLLLALSTSGFAAEPTVTKVGDWTVACYAGEPSCRVMQRNKSNATEFFEDILFFKDADHQLHLYWRTVALLRDKIVSIMVDGIQLGNTVPDQCGVDFCEGELTFPSDQAEKVLAGKEVTLVVPDRPRNESSLLFNSTDLAKALSHAPFQKD